MKIIVEESLLANFSLNSFILILTSFICDKRARFWGLSSLFGSAISLIYPLFEMGKISKIFFIVATCVFMCSLCFYDKDLKNFSKCLVVFLLCTFIFGGGCLFAQNIVGKVSVSIFVIISFGIFLVARWVIKYQKKQNKIKGFLYKFTIIDNGKTIEDEGFLDSGNNLYDPITKQPIMLVDLELFKKIYDKVSVVSLLSKIKNSSIKNGHYIKINGVGSGTSMLVFTIDELQIQQKSFKNVSVGLSFSGFEKAFGKDALLHCELV